MPRRSETPRAPSVPPEGVSGPSVARALRALLAEAGAPRVASAYLFGSRAEERAHAESDVDVGLLLCRDAHPRATDRFDAGLRLAGGLQAELGFTADVVVLNDAPPLLGRHIVTRGERILCDDADADHAYVRDVQLRAADLEPWLRRMRAIKLRAIRGA